MSSGHLHWNLQKVNVSLQPQLRWEIFSRCFQLLFCFCSTPFATVVFVLLLFANMNNAQIGSKKRNGWRNGQTNTKQVELQTLYIYICYSYSKLFLYMSQLNGQTNHVPLLENSLAFSVQNVFFNQENLRNTPQNATKLQEIRPYFEGSLSKPFLVPESSPKAFGHFWKGGNCRSAHLLGDH